MEFGSLDILAPRLFGAPCNEAEALGSAVWLWMHSNSHRTAPLHALNTLLLPAIKRQQFVLATEQGKPVFYLAWATLNAETEAAYLSRLPVLMPEADWDSGERMWILDWVAPFGHTGRMRTLVRRLFPDRCFRWLQHRGDERGLLIKRAWGVGVSSEAAVAWFDAHPLSPSPGKKP